MEVSIGELELVLRARDRRFHRNDLGLRIVHRGSCDFFRRIPLRDRLLDLCVRRGKAGLQGVQPQTRITVVDLRHNLALLDRITFNDRPRHQPAVEPACHGHDLTLHPSIVF
jgi:hypothetical protein